MTRKHFEAIARILRAHRAIGSADTFDIAWSLADYFESENPNFDRNRFLNAVMEYGNDQ